MKVSFQLIGFVFFSNKFQHSKINWQNPLRAQQNTRLLSKPFPHTHLCWLCLSLLLIFNLVQRWIHTWTNDLSNITWIILVPSGLKVEKDISQIKNYIMHKITFHQMFHDSCCTNAARVTVMWKKFTPSLWRAVLGEPQVPGSCPLWRAWPPTSGMLAECWQKNLNKRERQKERRRRGGIRAKGEKQNSHMYIKRKKNLRNQQLYCANFC